jgi:sRNA-binding regulator protein Hfq
MVAVYKKASEKFLMGSLLYVLIIASVVLSVHLLNSYQMTYAVENLDRFWSILTGEQQTPPVITDAIGYVGLKFQDDRTKLMYSVHAEHIRKVTAVYLYQIDKTQNGTIVLDLLHSPRELKSIDKVVDKTPQGKTKGTVSMGGAISDDLQGQLKGKTLSDLHKLIDNGTVYISIHTNDFPNGEIRGNSFVGIDRIFPDFTDIKWK